MRYLVGQKWVLALSFVLVLPGVAGAEGRALPIDRSREASLLQTAGGGFSIKRTPHFAIAYDTDRLLVDDLTGRLERTYDRVYRFCEVNGIAARRPDHRLDVVFFDKRASYDRYAARLKFPSGGTYGAYFEATNVSAFFNASNDVELVKLRAKIEAARASFDKLTRTMDEIKDGGARVEIRFADGRHLEGTKAELEKQLADEIDAARKELAVLDGRRQAYVDRINGMVIRHETAHQVLFNAGVHIRGASNPKWVVEGLACLFETPPGPTGTGRAAVNSLRLRDFRSAVAGGSKKERLTWLDYERAVAAGRLPPPQRLITDPGLFDERAGGSALYEATWALTRFLLRTQGDRLAAYLRAVVARRPGPGPTPAAELSLFEAHFGPIDEAFLERFSTYILVLNDPSPAGGL